MKTLLIVLLVAAAAFVAGRRFSAAQKIPTLSLPTPALNARVLPSAATVSPVARPVAGMPPALATVPPSDDGVRTLAAAIDGLTSGKSSFGQKQAILDQLRKGGHLEEAIAALKQLQAQNPNDPSVATALGEAQISQIRYLLENGVNPASGDVAILGIQADQNFAAALTQDPTNWEAQFEKAAAMAHWPPMMNKGPEVIQGLSTLVTQQETAAPKPEFALTFALLGEQYQAAGQGDQAAQIWQQGISRFPLDPTLQRELSSAPAR